MASAPIPLTNVGSGYTIVTQVIPSSTAPTTGEQNSSQTLSPLRKFLKGEPIALGAVQIMNGFLMLLLGIVLVGSPQPSFVSLGFAFWGSLLHILAGFLTVSASRKLHVCGVKGAMAMNILSAITAALSIITLSLDLMFIRMLCYSYDCRSSYTTMSRTRGITGVLLVFSLLQFAISIAISAFACKATCSNESTLNIINVVPNPEGHVPVDNSFPEHHTHPGVSTIDTVAMNSPPVGSPPAYSK